MLVLRWEMVKGAALNANDAVVFALCLYAKKYLLHGILADPENATAFAH